MGWRGSRKWTEEEKRDARIRRYFASLHRKALEDRTGMLYHQYEHEYREYLISGTIPEKLGGGRVPVTWDLA